MPLAAWMLSEVSAVQGEHGLVAGDEGGELIERSAGQALDDLAPQHGAGDDLLALAPQREDLLVFRHRHDRGLGQGGVGEDIVVQGAGGLARHVAAHGVARLGAQRNQQRGADVLVEDLEHREMRAGRLGGGAQLRLVRDAPVAQHGGVGERSGGEEHAAEEGVVGDQGLAAAGLVHHPRAAGVGGEQGPLEGGHGHDEGALGILAGDVDRAAEAQRHRHGADEVLDVAGDLGFVEIGVESAAAFGASGEKPSTIATRAAKS